MALLVVVDQDNVVLSRMASVDSVARLGLGAGIAERPENSLDFSAFPVKDLPALAEEECGDSMIDQATELRLS